MNLKARDIILALSVRCHGEWKDIYEIVVKKIQFTDEEFQKEILKEKAPFFAITDDEYPDYFKSVYQPPFLLYYYGNLDILNKGPRLTVVGTRKPNDYQNEVLPRLLKECFAKMKKKVVLVSGMAEGIDSLAMRTAMEEQIPVIGILGSGIDNPYPESSKDIYEYCKSGKGIVLSEYPLKSKPLADHFTFRNRLLAACGQVVFVAGGKNRSGTSSTARQALEQGKDILALPCNITGDDLTNTLIRDGARPVLESLDLCEALKDFS